MSKVPVPERPDTPDDPSALAPKPLDAPESPRGFAPKFSSLSPFKKLAILIAVLLTIGVLASLVSPDAPGTATEQDSTAAAGEPGTGTYDLTGMSLFDSSNGYYMASTDQLNGDVTGYVEGPLPLACTVTAVAVLELDHGSYVVTATPPNDLPGSPADSLIATFYGPNGDGQYRYWPT